MKRWSIIVFLLIVGIVSLSGVGAADTPFLVYAQDDNGQPTVTETVVTKTVVVDIVIDDSGRDTAGTITFISRD